MSDCEFTLKFSLPPDADPEDYVERLGDCGCDDAIVGVGQKGRIALSFNRTADSAEEAILSAIADVRCAIQGAEVLEVSPDLVGITDVAELLCVSRQNVRKLLLTCKSPGPAPVHEGRPTIWHLAKLLRWLEQEKDYRIDRELMTLAEATMQVNLTVATRDVDASSQERILHRIA